MSEQMIILCEDEEYAAGLMAYMKEKKSSFDIVVFTELDLFQEFLSKRKTELLVFSEYYLKRIKEKLMLPKDMILILLREEKGKLLEEDCHYHQVFKYQSVNQIMRDIILCYEEQRGNTVEQVLTGENEVMVVCSLNGDQYSYTYAQTLAEEFSRKKKTLWISFSPFLTQSGSKSEQNMGAVSDLIYYAKNWNRETLGKIKRLMNTCKAYDVLCGVCHWTDISALSEKEAEYLIQQVRSHLSYEIIIIDIGIFSNLTAALFRTASKIFEICFEEELIIGTQEEFEKQFVRIDGVDLLKKLELVSKKMWQGG